MKMFEFIMVADNPKFKDQYLILADNQSNATALWMHFATKVIAHTGWRNNCWQMFIEDGVVTDLSDLIESTKEGLCVYDHRGWRVIGKEEVE